MAEIEVTRAGERTTRGDGLEIVLLGTKGGPPPTAERTGISSALVVDGAVYLVDVGRAATTQYVRAGLRFADLRGVFVTHLHADHIADYFTLFLLAGNANPSHRDALPDSTPVFGPGPAGWLPPAFGGGDVPTANPEAPTPGLLALTDSAAAAFAYSTNVFARDSHSRITRSLADVREIPVDGLGAGPGRTAPDMEPIPVFEDERVRVSAVLVPHGPVFPAFAFRFDTAYGSATFSGDTTYSDNLLRLARRTDVLVHEAINVDGWPGPPAVLDHLLEGHVEVQRVGEVAHAAEAGALVLSHLGDLVHGDADPVQWRAWAQRGYAGTVHVGADLDVIRMR